jgi:hypothetical protein
MMAFLLIFCTLLVGYLGTLWVTLWVLGWLYDRKHR